MIQNKPIPTNISELAIEMREGFSRVDIKFDQLEEKIEKKIDHSIEGLALMVKKGFDEVDAHFVEIRDEMVTKEEFDYRLDTLEKVILKDYGVRIRRVERKLQLA